MFKSLQRKFQIFQKIGKNKNSSARNGLKAEKDSKERLKVSKESFKRLKNDKTQSFKTLKTLKKDLEDSTERFTFFKRF